MDLQMEKDRALTFLKNLDKPNVKELDGLLSNDVEFEMMGRLPCSRRTCCRWRAGFSRR